MTMTNPPIFQVGHLERMPLGTPYPGIVARVGRLLQQLPARTELVIDITPKRSFDRANPLLSMRKSRPQR